MGNISLFEAQLNKEYTVENILLENPVSRLALGKHITSNIEVKEVKA